MLHAVNLVCICLGNGAAWLFNYNKERDIS